MIVFQCRDGVGRVVGEKSVRGFDSVRVVNGAVVCTVHLEDIPIPAISTVSVVGMLGEDGVFIPVEMTSPPERFLWPGWFTVDLTMICDLRQPMNREREREIRRV